LYRVHPTPDLERLTNLPTRSFLIDLKNRRIAVRIDDPELRRQLSELLMKNGAVVHGARDEVELQRLVDRLGVEVAVVDRMAIEIVLAAVKPVRIGLN
jgi:hypothetical protein